MDILSGGGSTSGSRKRALRQVSDVAHGSRHPVFAITVQCWYNFYQCVIMGIVLLVVWLPQRNVSPFRWRWSDDVGSVFITLADAAYFYALTYPDAMISVTSMVRRGSVIVSFCFSAMIFREKESAVESRRPLPGVAQHGVSVDRRTLRENK